MDAVTKNLGNGSRAGIAIGGGEGKYSVGRVEKTEVSGCVCLKPAASKCSVRARPDKINVKNVVFHAGKTNTRVVLIAGACVLRVCEGGG